jgi:hypothetical protein
MKKNIPIIALLAVMLLVAACAVEAVEEGTAKSSGSLAMVDQVEVQTIDIHQYAVVQGHYPDPCTRISDIDQTVEGKRFIISLSTDRPDDLVCAAMLEAFEVALLLETGGLLPGDYTVVVNDRETSFTLDQ